MMNILFTANLPAPDDAKKQLEKMHRIKDLLIALKLLWRSRQDFFGNCER